MILGNLLNLLRVCNLVKQTYHTGKNIMSSPPVKDLYEKLGKKLKEKENKASQLAESKLRNFYSDELNKSYFKSPEIKKRFMQIQNSKYIDTNKLYIKIHEKPRGNADG